MMCQPLFLGTPYLEVLKIESSFVSQKMLMGEIVFVSVCHMQN